MSHVADRLSRSLVALVTFTLASLLPVLAQSPAAIQASARFQTMPSLTTRAALEHHVPLWANQSNDQGAVDASRSLTNLHLILNRAPEVQAAFDQLLADQHNPSSPRFHQWLTPEQNAAQYGIAASDLAVVTNWLESSGLSVDHIDAGGVFITFHGPASAVETAFSTPLHQYSVDGATRYAPASTPSIPSALSSILHGVFGLSENIRSVHTHIRKLDTPITFTGNRNAGRSAMSSTSPDTTFTSGDHALAPGDFNTIYDITASISAGTNGTGTKVGNIIDSHIYASDVSAYETFFGLPSNVVNQIVLDPQHDPGISSSSESEAVLDVQRILGTAPNTTVNLLIIDSLSDTDIATGLQYEISTLNDAAVNMSFGGCDTSPEASQDALNYESYYKAATAQGISIFNSSGDNGAAGCNPNYKTIPANQVQAANVLCMSGYVTCVGGTEFADAAAPSSYWAAQNNSTTKASALGYIPEGAWNEPSYIDDNGNTVWDGAGTGGGPGVLPKPSWQTGTGVPTDSLRDTPDIAFTAADHDGYLICEADIQNNCSSGSFTYILSGTSASSPSMAGIAALTSQKLGSRLGNLNPMLYSLFNKSSAAGTFHDTTIASSGVTNCSVNTPSMCNNSTPSSSGLSGGLAGFLLQTGYDMATGLGSLDVGNFLTQAAAYATQATSLAVTASPNPITVNSTTTLTATLTPSTITAGAATGTVTFYTVSGGTATQIGTAQTLSNGVATLPYTPTTTGTITIRAIYSGDTLFSASTSPDYSLTVSSNTFTITPATLAYPASGTLLSGSSVTDAITIRSASTFAGTVALTCTATAANSTSTAAGTCSISPASVTLTAGGTQAATLTVNTTAGTSGQLNVVVTGTSGSSVINSSTVTLTLTAPSFTITPSQTSITVTGGSTVNNTTTLAVTSTGFAGAVTFACQLQAQAGTGQVALPSDGTCSASAVTLIANGTATSTLTISATGVSSSLFAHVTASATNNGFAVTPAPTADVAIVVTKPITISAAPATLSFTSGATSGNTSTITVTAQTGVSGTASLACSITGTSSTAAPTCAVAPSSVALTSGNASTATLTIGSTTAHTQVQTQKFSGFTGWKLAALLLASLGCFAFRRRRALVHVALLGLLALGLSTMTGCGDNAAPKTTITSAGTYTVVVTATLGSYSTNTQVTVNIQ